MTPTVAVLGTGILGRAIAERLQASGCTVVVFNRTASKALQLQRQGIAVVGSAEMAVSQSDCALLVLADSAAVRSTLLKPSCSVALRGKTLVQMGTIDPEQSIQLQEDIERSGGVYCEAPVLGSVAEAKEGTLFVMVGGSEQQFAACLPVFRVLSREPRHVGPVGRASALKLALNHLIAAETSAFALSLGLVQRFGIPVDAFMAILRGSALYAPTFDKKLPRLLKRDYHRPNFSTRHLLKDVRLVLNQAAALGLSTKALDGLPVLLEEAIARGLGDLDYSALFEVVSPSERDSARS